jgi:hypothetical protein
MSEDEAPSEKSHEDKGSPEKSFRFSLAEVSALLAVFGAMTYVLGLFALWVPIARAYTHDFTSAWYAASLVPKTIIAGQGVKELLGLPLFTVLGVVVVIMIRQLTLRSDEDTAEAAFRRFSWFLIAITAICVPFFGYYPLFKTLTSSAMEGSYVDVLGVYLEHFRYIQNYAAAWVVLLGASLTALYLSYNREFLGLQLSSENPLPKVTDRRLVLSSFALVFGLSFLGGFVNTSLYSQPPMPTVEITGTSKVEGALLTHTEGFWYVFNQDGELIAIPDDEVKTVRVSPAEE